MLIPVDKECKYSYYVLAESKRVQWDFLEPGQSFHINGRYMILLRRKILH